MASHLESYGASDMELVACNKEAKLFKNITSKISESNEYTEILILVFQTKEMYLLFIVEV